MKIRKLRLEKVL